ncbi:MAG: hypothetical protein FJX62_16445 [Alphaproteobacteria bacterium]|nr:hypothetical protein [Alphaproteobacteria bacterium]
MRKQLLTMAALASLAAALAMPQAAQAAVAGPTDTMARAAQALDMTEEVRRICTRQLRCRGPFKCRWERVCRISRDYPPRRRR